ncbi:MAG TPA: hypothetical protein VN855_00625 [Candidatus Acidoferrum sp.]|nr:hypothetical protein [Candidatus Acidoferrum sp.]
MSLKIKIDASGIAAQFKEFAVEVEKDIKKSARELSYITYEKTRQMAEETLKSSSALKPYLDSLAIHEIAEGLWIITVDEKGIWVEEGIESGFDMKPGLLKNAQISEKGYKYKVIPFEHSKAPSQLHPKAKEIVSTLRKALDKKGIPFRKNEKNPDGSMKLGKLHSLNIKSEVPGRGNTPALQRVSIYQTLTKTGDVRRDIFTFRTVTGGPASEGKWIHPGYAKKQFLDKSYLWAVSEWEKQILPAILNKWK